MIKSNYTKVLGLLAGAFALTAVAKPKKIDPYFDVQAPTIESYIEPQIPDSVLEQMASQGLPLPLPLPGGKDVPGFPGGLGNDGDNSPSPTVMINEIINIGERIWKLVEKGQPVVNVNFPSANALPKGIEGWETLGEWQAPTSRHFKVSYVNGYGSEVLNFVYRIITTTGGNYKGVGKYIAQISTLPAQVEASWGYTFNAENTIPNVFNVGTQAAPIAGAEISVKWDVHTMIKHIKTSQTYFIRGDGEFKSLNE